MILREGFFVPSSSSIYIVVMVDGNGMGAAEIVPQSLLLQ